MRIWPNLHFRPSNGAPAFKFEYVPVLLGGIYKANRQYVAGESLRGQEQRIPGAGDAALPPPPQHHKIPAEPVFFPVNTLMLMRGAVARSSRVCSNLIFAPPTITCGKSPRRWMMSKFFRSAFAASGIDIETVEWRARKQDDVKEAADRLTTDAVNRGAFVHRPSLSARKCFSGKDQLRDVRGFDRRADQPRDAENPRGHDPPPRIAVETSGRDNLPLLRSARADETHKS